MRSFRKRPSQQLLIGIVVALVLLPAFVVMAQNDKAVSTIQTVSGPQVEAYWTEARLRGAKSLNMPILTTTRRQPPDQQVRGASGPGIVAYSGGPGERAVEKTIAAAIADQIPTFGTFPFSYTRYRLFPDTRKVYKVFPHNLIGQLFFTIPSQGNFVCTAESINAANSSVIWTAGHCVNTPGIGFHTNFIFFPAKRLNKAPFGSWTALQAVTTAGWANSALLEYDHGALALSRGGKNNNRIGFDLGFLGFIADVSRQQHWNPVGYPVDPRNLPSTPPGDQYDGLHQEICGATWAIDDLPTGGAGDPPTIGIGCDFTGGSSGGPWLIDYSGVIGATNLVNGNNSYKYGTEPLNIYGPYFSTAAVNVRNLAGSVAIP